MKRCAAHRAQALDYVLGDVVGLERTRMEAHLDRCESCGELVSRLSAAFSAAKRWPPEPAAQDLEHLISRLEPYFEPDEPRAPLFGGFARAVLAAAAATAAIVFFAASYTKDQVPISEPLAVVETAPVEIAAPPPPPPAVIVRLKPRPHVKLVAGGGWDGKVAGESNDATSIVMSRGFAMIDFEGGQGRKLWVGAPNASIEVVGTRFFVDTAPNGLTTVGVIAGKVVVATAEGRAAIAAGERRTFGDARSARPAPSAAETFAEDPFLARQGHTATTEQKKHPRVVHDASASIRVPMFDPTRELSAAQRLARGSDPRAALAKYEDLLARLGEKDPLAPLVRYERARLLAFSLGEKTRGELELHAVADAGRGEASLQAKLSLCEIRLPEDRCAAARCLEALRAREHDTLSTEIDRLFARWQLNQAGTCDHK